MSLVRKAGRRAPDGSSGLIAVKGLAWFELNFVFGDINAVASTGRSNKSIIMVNVLACMIAGDELTCIVNVSVFVEV
jgi:hypothetical protein